MNKRLITDEHIVAYLDGELHVSADFESDLRKDPALARAVKEYSVIGNAFARSGADERFMLSSSVDNSARKMLANVIRKERKEAAAIVAVPEKLVTAVRNVKYLWAKRAGFGLGLAALAVSLWFNFNGKTELITQVPAPHQFNTTAPESVAPAPTAVPANKQYAANVAQPSTTVTAQRVSHTPKNTTPVFTTDNLVLNTSQTEAPPQTQEKADPADAMISHRYAKLIKATRSVEVTDQDKVSDQM
jgi:anti-sigma factor RsiW